MGTDIHDYTEVQQPDGRWTSGPTGLYEDRRYDLFAILGNVRNGVGFAGVKTGSGFTPIDDPRGVPDDCSDLYLRAVDEYGIDGHSHSWLMLSEILDFDWTRTTTKVGVVDLLTYLDDWKGRPTSRGPKSYCNSISGPGVVVLDENDPRLSELRLDDASSISGVIRPYVRVSWQVTYAQSCRNFWVESIPRLLRLGPPDRVRLVFFFDN